MNRTLFVFYMVLFLLPIVSAQTILSSHADQTCHNNVCTATLYSFTKYYQSQGQWLPINENIQSQGCELGFTHCVLNNLYQAQFSNNEVKVVRGLNSVSIVPVSIGTSPSSLFVFQNPSVVVHDNVLTYTTVFSNANVSYTYLPEKLKEELTLPSMPSLQPGSTLNFKSKLILPQNAQLLVGNDIVSALNFGEVNPYLTSSAINIVVNGEVGFSLPSPVAFDSDGGSVHSVYALYGNGSDTFIDIRTPYAWLVSAAYPVMIDPTIELNASKMTWNGYLHHNATHYFRTDNPLVLKVGRFFRNFSTVINDTYRSVLEFDTSTIPRDASIQKIDLLLYSTQAGTGGNNNLSIHPLEKNNTQYANENQSCFGNCNHYVDAGNGTFYTSKNTSSGFNLFNVDSSINDFTTTLQSQSWFSYGLVSHDGESQFVHGNQDARIAGKDYPFPSNRPVLNITYITNPANESDGRTAIETGINSTINTPITTDQQIYVVNWSSSTQTLNKFDKYTQKNNQSWAFNYVTAGESFTNIPSWLNRLIIWENNTLTTDQITSQVQGIIANTTI